LFEIFGHKQLRFESALQSSAPNTRGLEAARWIITHSREMGAPVRSLRQSSCAFVRPAELCV